METLSTQSMHRRRWLPPFASLFLQPFRDDFGSRVAARGRALQLQFVTSELARPLHLRFGVVQGAHDVEGNVIAIDLAILEFDNACRRGVVQRAGEFLADRLQLEGDLGLAHHALPLAVDVGRRRGGCRQHCSQHQQPGSCLHVPAPVLRTGPTLPKRPAAEVRFRLASAITIITPMSRFAVSAPAGRGIPSHRLPTGLRPAAPLADHADMRMTLRLVLGAAAAVAAGMAPAGEAGSGRVLLQPPPVVVPSPITDRFAVRVLYYEPAINNRLRYDSSAGVPGTPIDVEELLGHRDFAYQGTIDMMIRIGERHRINTDFYQLRRTGDVVIDQQVRFGDDVYAGGDRLVSETELRKLGLTYTWSFLRREKLELGVGLGLHLLQLQGRTSVPASFTSEQLDTAGPFAALAGHASWRI